MYRNFYYPEIGGITPVVAPDDLIPEQTPQAGIKPKTRKELYWAKMAGEDVTLPDPKTPEEAYLSKMAGEDITLPDPKTPKEYYMKSVAENGGGMSGWKEVNLITADNLEWTIHPKDPGTYYVVIEQEIDVEHQDFIICTFGDEVEQYRSVCEDTSGDLFQLANYYDSDADISYTVDYQPQNHVVEILFASKSSTPTANSFILNKLTKANLSDPSQDPVFPVAPGTAVDAP